MSSFSEAVRTTQLLSLWPLGTTWMPGVMRQPSRINPLRCFVGQVLIFSQFIGMLDMVQEFLSLRGHKHERLDGRTTGNERQKSIDR